MKPHSTWQVKQGACAYGGGTDEVTRGQVIPQKHLQEQLRLAVVKRTHSDRMNSYTVIDDTVSKRCLYGKEYR